MSTTSNLFNWDEPMRPPAKAKRCQPKGNPSPIGSGPAGETCKTCAHSYAWGGGRNTYWKCDLTSRTNGPGTDIRLKWQACSQWKKKETKS